MEMCVTDGTGHATMICNREDSTNTVSEVRAEFNRLIAANYVAFDVGTDQKGSRRLDKWEPSVENVRVIAPMAGG